MRTLTPFELWVLAGADRERYRELLVEHGHLLPGRACSACGATFRHRHQGRVVIRVDIFGHDVFR